MSGQRSGSANPVGIVQLLIEKEAAASTMIGSFGGVTGDMDWTVVDPAFATVGDIKGPDGVGLELLMDADWPDRA